jgi:hypothetical protein
MDYKKGIYVRWWMAMKLRRWTKYYKQAGSEPPLTTNSRTNASGSSEDDLITGDGWLPKII